MGRIIAETGLPRYHRPILQGLAGVSSGPVRVASAYVTDRKLLVEARSDVVQLLTTLRRMDVVSGATSLEAIRDLVAGGVECRCVSKGRLHAKVYIFGCQAAVVTSANLTANALDSNIEVGVQVKGNDVEELID